jgi:hypothetical protein
VEKTKLTRRNLILRTPAFLAGLLLFGGGFFRSVTAAVVKKNPKRPPGTCGGWLDRNLNGTCERSEGGPKPCNSQNCPANKKNSKRHMAKDNGAPDGACALWKDSDSQGFCEVSIRASTPCAHDACPAHKDKATPSA